MKSLLAALFLTIGLLSTNTSEAANNSIIKHPTELQVLQYLVYKESRGESVRTMRAVLDIAHNRARKYKMTLLEVVRERGQFPWHSKFGIRKISDKKFLQKFWNAFMMSPILTGDYLYFNHKPFKWGKSTRKIGNLFFSK